MTQKFSFKNLDDRIDRHREILLNAMQEEYKLADKFDIDPSSRYIQEHIYNRFRREITNEELILFSKEFYELTIQRDKALQQYVASTIDKLQNWKDNEDLVRANFIRSITRDTKTNSESTRITPVTSYYNERTIEKILRERPNDYISKHIRPDGTIAIQSEIEILSTSNETALYNPLETEKGQELESSKYIILSRIKNSEREMKKLVDWLENLRDKEDYPYDAIAVRVVFQNKKSVYNVDNKDITYIDIEKNLLNIGEQLYALRDQIVTELQQYDEVIQKNMHTKIENEKSIIKKLQIEEFNPENFLEVTKQMRDTYNYLEQRYSKNIALTNDQKETLLPYMTIKGVINNERIEIQLMTEEMDYHYRGKYVGHTRSYIAQRDEERDKYLRNPAESNARKNIKKEENLNKNNTNGTQNHNLPSIEDIINNNSIKINTANNNSIKEPNIKILTKMLEDMYRPVFRVYSHHSFGAQNIVK